MLSILANTLGLTNKSNLSTVSKMLFRTIGPLLPAGRHGFKKRVGLGELDKDKRNNTLRQLIQWRLFSQPRKHIHLKPCFSPVRSLMPAWQAGRPIGRQVQLRIQSISTILAIANFSYAQPDPPSNFTATGYDYHIELRWDRTTDPSVNTYRLYRENTPGDFQLLRTLTSNDTLHLDLIGAHNIVFSYYVTSRTILGVESEPSPVMTAATFEMTDDQFLDMVQEYTFRYFWDFAHPVSGLARERNTSGETVTMGGSGFGIMGILVGIERGFITWEQGLARMLKIILFLEDADRFHGVFPHWMNGSTGEVIPFSPMDNGGDLVETAFLFQGLLTAREYFDGNTANEVVLRQKITNMWQEINWDFYRNGKSVLLWHWSPTFGFALNHEIRGWNEALIIYLLAIASPTHAVLPALYHTGWAGGNYVNGFSIYGHKLFVGSVTGGPLFFAHYSFMGFDPRFNKDQYANYFIHNRNHTLVNRAYCIHNPENHIGYSDVCWGLTASDDPLVGYLAHEATLARDNGTIAPTAALSSMPYTPEESLAALKHFYREHGDRLWGPMGFYDAFNLTENWFASSYLAIDQGPIICMIENHRTQLLWENFMRNPEIDGALDAIGFEPDSTLVSTNPDLRQPQLKMFPNPSSDILSVECPADPEIKVEIRNVFGSVVLEQKFWNSAGAHQLSIAHLLSGVYFLSVERSDGQLDVKKFSIVR